MASGTGKARFILRALPLILLDIVATGISYIVAAWGTGVFGQILALGDFSQMVAVIALINIVIFDFYNLTTSFMFDARCNVTTTIAGNFNYII